MILIAYLDGGGIEESRLEGGRVSYITLFGCFLREEGERFGRVLTTSNSSFLISQNWRNLKGE